MKEIFSRTLRFGRLSITLFSNEILFVYVGRRKVTVKTLRFKPDVRAVVAVMTVLFLAALSMGMVYYMGSAPESSDDIIKNSLLMSRETDFKEPEVKKELVIHQHVVKNKENLNSISKKYGVSMDTVCGSNGLTSYDFINVGRSLNIPSRDGILYKFQRGDRVASLAGRYRIPLEKIVYENKLRNPDFVSVNTVLFIPDARPQNIVVGFLWPTSRRIINCGYGWRRNPFDSRTREFHQGMDIWAMYEWVRASKYGQVTYTGWLEGYGRAVIVAHPGGWKTLYAHLSSIVVKPGQYVRQGQPVARSGNTGRSTGPHLHFEIIKNGSPINPYRYLARPAK